MTDFPSTPRPGWQTEELEDEWLEEIPGDDDDDDDDNLSYGTRSISLTAPLTTEIRTSVIERDSEPSDTSSQPLGTFLIREDVPAVPLLPRTPGRNNKKGRIKDFFSPLPLERMFEPPSPPLDNILLQAPPMLEHLTAHSLELHGAGSDGHEAGDKPSDSSEDGAKTATKMSNMSSVSGRKASMECKFTFAVPRPGSIEIPEGFPQAHSTPGQPSCTSGATATQVLPNDPRLRLFQFQYDTFTREHLSAMVDSIAINTTSGASGTTNGSLGKLDRGLSPVTEFTGPSTSHLRSAKRVKLSPRSDFYGEGDGAGAVISRPRHTRKDYVGESRSLMQQIRQARDFSTISTVASLHTSPPFHRVTENSPDQKSPRNAPEVSRPAFLDVPSHSGLPCDSSGGVSCSKSGYSSSSYRQQAAALMAQIKSDMNGSKRLFSCDTEQSHIGSQTYASSPSPYTLQLSTSADKENIRNHPQQPPAKLSDASNVSFTPARVKCSPSPGKQSSAVDETKQNQLKQASNMILPDERDKPLPILHPIPEPNPLHLPPQPLPLLEPSYPSTAVRAAPNEDLKRFVSSSTASGTTLTVGSACSAVKPAGPVQIRRITPEDLPSLPERVGKMIFDKVMMRWVKATVMAAAAGVVNDEHLDGMEGESGESEDPFRDIESLREDDSGMAVMGSSVDERVEHSVDVGMSLVEELEEANEEEVELTSFSFDDPSAGVVNVMTGVETDGMDDDETTDSEDEDHTERVTAQDDHGGGFDSEDDSQPDAEVGHELEQMTLQPPITAVSQSAVVFGTPSQAQRGLLPVATPILARSPLKSASATPVSALKDPNRHRTPVNKPGHRRRRSVSFSDGKRDGPIRGLGRNVVHAREAGQRSQNTSFIPSARSKRIADLMGDLEDSDFENETPSKTSSSARPDELHSLATQNLSISANATAGSSRGNSPRRRILSRSVIHKRSPAGKGGSANGNETLLTECSFGVAHDRLVQVITDVQPFEPHWEGLSSIDLANRKLESVARLKEFLPQLDSLQLNSNQLSWLSGIPGTVRTLSVASNNLTAISSYGHLLNLESLDISRNDINSLRQLECLRHLRELRADANKITCIDGLQGMERLVKLSLQGNCIRVVDLRQYRWTRLEMLNLCQNELDQLSGLSSLGSLIALNIDHNSLGELEPGVIMGKLRILRVSSNQLRGLNVGHFPNLRTLYLDNNSVEGVIKVDRLPKLENLSIRNQSGRARGLNFLTRDARDVKRLYLSGNALKSGFLDEPCYNLVYLELAACRLTTLPQGLGQLVPNLRVLNLNYNFLEDVGALVGLGRLRKLTIIGSRLKGTKGLIRLLQRLPEVEMLDCRMNPCTLGWYLPLLVKDVPGALQPCEGESGREKTDGGRVWQELDCKFRRDLPDEVYIGRLAYRGLVMRACPRIRMLDGVEVSKKERAKAEEVLAGILSRGEKKGKVGLDPSG